jgi:hypothetical protein
MDEIRELEGIPDKEDRGVIPDHVVISLLGVELNRKAAGVARSISRAFFTSHSGKSDKDICPLTHFREEFGLGIFSHISGDFKIAACPCSFGVYNALRDTFTVEMRKLFEKVDVLHKNWPTVTSSHGVLVVANRYSKSGG